MTTMKNDPTVLLVPGHWLGSWAWNEVVAHLEADQISAVSITLPGLDGDDADRALKTVDDQVAAIRESIAEQGDQPVVLVAHSGANIPVTLVLDRYPELVTRVVWVDSGPVADGTAFAPEFPAALQELPLPSFEDLEQQASLDGLSSETLERFRTKAVPQPAAVLRQAVKLTNEKRHSVPTTLVCCSILGEQVMGLVEVGHPMFAEVANFTNLDVVDLPTGHWPMWSRSLDLAEIIRAVSHSS